MRVAAGVDLGGTAINYTFVDEQRRFLIDGLFEHPARSKEGPPSACSKLRTVWSSRPGGPV